MDYTASLLVLELVFEFWWRSMPVYWTFTAAYSIPVFTFMILLGLSFIIEFQVAWQPSSLLEDTNVAGILPIGTGLALMLLDGIGSLVVPTAIIHWTLPLTWIINFVAAILVVLAAGYDRSWRRIVVSIGAAFIGYFLAPYLPFKLVAFLIALQCHVALASTIRALDITVHVTEDKTPKPATLYRVGCFLALLFDFLTSHYTSLGGEHWIRLGGMLAAQSVLLVPYAVTLPSFLAATLMKQKEERKKAQNNPTAEKEDKEKIKMQQ